ncbi:MAG: hypothetical protein JWR50_4019 [Mucilaginibacter sp.]|nr:hypothetical protein [Mucilaginibacter sp.]
MKPITNLLFVLLLFGCGHHYDPYAIRMPSKQPLLKNVVGVYRFQTQTVNDKLKRGVFKNASITLNADSSFTATNIPDFAGNTDFKYNGIISAKGKWHMQKLRGLDNSIDDKPVWGIALTNLPVNLQAMAFGMHKAPYQLMVFYGDQRKDKVMLFTSKR